MAPRLRWTFSKFAFVVASKVAVVAKPDCNHYLLYTPVRLLQQLPCSLQAERFYMLGKRQARLSFKNLTEVAGRNIQAGGQPRQIEVRGELLPGYIVQRGRYTRVDLIRNLAGTRHHLQLSNSSLCPAGSGWKLNSAWRNLRGRQGPR
jgi:hypothetical protein